MAKTIPQEFPDTPAPVIIADENTMTVYEMTVGQLVQTAKADVERILRENKAKDDHIRQLERTIEDLRKAPTRVLSGLTRHQDGAVSLRIVVSPDVAPALLSQAQEAGEDPGVYIQRNVEEALLAFAMS